MKTTSLFLLMGATLCACSSTDQTPIADTTVGQYSLHIFREGPACTAGAMTTFVVKPTAGGTPTAIMSWVGAATDDTGDDATKVAAIYDSTDGDFDIDYTCPTPVPAGAKLFVMVDGTVGSVDLK
jgi:hypothetical protein